MLKVPTLTQDAKLNQLKKKMLYLRMADLGRAFINGEQSRTCQCGQKLVTHKEFHLDYCSQCNVLYKPME